MYRLVGKGRASADLGPPRPDAAHIVAHATLPFTHFMAPSNHCASRHA